MEGTTHIPPLSRDRYLHSLAVPLRNDGTEYQLYQTQGQMNNYQPYPPHSAGHQLSINGGLHAGANTQYTPFMMEPLQQSIYNIMPIPKTSKSAKVTPKRRLRKGDKFKQSPAVKRQKVFDTSERLDGLQNGSSSKADWDNLDICDNPGCHVYSGNTAVSVTGSRVSECCSSCSEGLPCDEPDCDLQKEAVIPCNKESCNKPVCPEPCLPNGQTQISNWQQGIIPSSERISSWNSTPWNTQAPRAYSSDVHGNRIDPTLINAAESVLSGPASPDPSTPSIAQNMETPYSTEQGLSTPQFTGSSSNGAYLNGSAPTVSGTGTMFDTSDWTGFVDSTFGNGTFNCAWAECQLPFSTPEEWSSHLHQVHVDPQMSFDCPLQSDACPEHLTSHPLDHLQAAHGFDFTYNNYICPAPACLENETFCNPAMLHNHFDQAHAIPVSGSLYCQWNDCNSTFTDQRELMYHLTSDHRLIDAAKEQNVQENVIQPDTATYPADIPDEELSETESNSPCQWNTGTGRCSVICENPKELQEHINEHHLKDLNKSTGYFCQWENCNRKKMGDKAGFSQRGKLVRHMQTHTILKEEVCDFPGCGKQFSAKQALLQHKRLHTGEKPFKCIHCDRAFAQQSACTMHERTHTGLKPLQCEHCGKRFSESSNLSKHRRMHEEEKDKKSYKCDVPGCGKAFVRLASLKNHRKEAHTGLERVKEESSDMDVDVDGRVSMGVDPASDGSLD